MRNREQLGEGDVNRPNIPLIFPEPVPPNARPPEGLPMPQPEPEPEQLPMPQPEPEQLPMPQPEPEPQCCPDQGQMGFIDQWIPDNVQVNIIGNIQNIEQNIDGIYQNIYNLIQGSLVQIGNSISTSFTALQNSISAELTDVETSLTNLQSIVQQSVVANLASVVVGVNDINTSLGISNQNLTNISNTLVSQSNILTQAVSELVNVNDTLTTESNSVVNNTENINNVINQLGQQPEQDHPTQTTTCPDTIVVQSPSPTGLPTIYLTVNVSPDKPVISQNITNNSILNQTSNNEVISSNTSTINNNKSLTNNVGPNTTNIVNSNSNQETSNSTNDTIQNVNNNQTTSIDSISRGIDSLSQGDQPKCLELANTQYCLNDCAEADIIKYLMKLGYDMDQLNNKPTAWETHLRYPDIKVTIDYEGSEYDA